MLIIADRKVPVQAIDRLNARGEVLLLDTHGITYEAISGHPDIFFCLVNEYLVVAPNLPASYIEMLAKKRIRYVLGEQPVGAKYPETAKYNAVGTDKYLLHNFRYTDSAITDRIRSLDLINVNQGYARCSLIPLKNDRFITSDEGIFRVLVSNSFETLLVNPSGILLPGFKNGFIGGTAGILEDEIFFIGKLEYFPEGDKISQFLSRSGYNVTELYDGPLFDGGSILFIPYSV